MLNLSSKSSSRAAALALACALPFTFAACGEKTLEAGSAEKEISEKLVELRGVKPKKVECPDDMKAKKGEKYECTLTAPNGDELPVELTMADDDGKFEFEVGQEKK